MKLFHTSCRALGASAVAALSLCLVGAPSFAQDDDGSDIVAVGKTGNRYVYKIRGLFVVASVRDVIAGCVVRSTGALDCQGGSGGLTLSEIEARPGAVAETLSEKNRLLQEQARRLEAQQAEIEEMRRLLNERAAAPAFPSQPAFDATVTELEPVPAFDQEDDLNF
jgi:hypothetical protein